MMRCIKTGEGRGGTICKIEPSLYKEAVQICILPSRSCLYQASENFVDLDAAHHRSSNTGGLCFPCSWFKCVGECSEMRDHCQAPSVILMTTKEHKATCLWSPLQGLWCQTLTRATRDRLAGGDRKHADFLFLIAALESIPSDSEKAQGYSFFFFNPPMSTATLFESSLSNGFSKNNAETISHKDEIIIWPAHLWHHW